ncbi:MAG: hypothetical protein SGJ23_04585 [Alphaproteobacteria bacterium]|nr:hypothetical protein [Alphaproteobacteria bacterium]
MRFATGLSVVIAWLRFAFQRRQARASRVQTNCGTPNWRTFVRLAIAVARSSAREELVPAVYKTVTRQVVDQPATTREIDVPAQYETLSREVKVADSSSEWRVPRGCRWFACAAAP